jgi:hypothetical protein
MSRIKGKWLLAIALICLAGAALVNADPVTWRMTLSGTDGAYHSSVDVGATVGATDGFDSLFDAAAPPAPPPPSCEITSHITNPNPNRTRLSRDLRSAVQETLLFDIRRDVEDDTITVSWSLPDTVFAPTLMQYGVYYPPAPGPTSYTTMLSAPFSADMPGGSRLRIMYVKAPGIDTLPPTVGNLNPLAGNRLTSLRAVPSCDITDFSNVDPSSIVFVVSGDTVSGARLHTMPIHNGLHVYTDTLSFVDSELVQVCVQASDMSGRHNRMTAPFCWTFTTGSGDTTDLIPPTVQNPSPTNGRDSVALSGLIQVFFEDNQTGPNLNSIVFTFNGVAVPDSLLLFTSTPMGYMVTYAYSGLTPGTRYNWCIRGCDLAPIPNCITDTCFHFTTTPSPVGCDSFGMHVQIFNMDAGGANIASNTLTFGAMFGAVDGFDAHDVNVPFIIPGIFQSYFPQGTDTLNPNYHLSTDIRGCVLATHIWKIKATSVSDHLEAHWNMVDFINPLLPAGAEFKIGVSNDEATRPDDSLMVNMRDIGVIRGIGASQVVWITYNHSVDTTPITVRYKHPDTGDTVCTTDTVRFQVVDLESGVDRSTLHIYLAGSEITSQCIITSAVSGMGYDVLYLRANMLPNATVTVRVVADNNAIPPIHGDVNYQFQTGPTICATEWLANIQVHGVNGSDTSTVQLYFGTNAAGTDGYDSGLDGVAPPPPPSGLDRVFSITASRPEFERLLRDIRSSHDSLDQWKMINGSDEESFSPLFVTWDPIAMPGNCVLSIWQHPAPDPGEPDVLDNMHSSSSFTYVAGTPIYIRYVTAPIHEAFLAGNITLEDHTDYSGTSVHIVSTVDTAQYWDLVTDAAGHYAISNPIAAGCYTITASHDSFTTLDSNVCLVEGNNTVNGTLLWVRHAFCGTVTLSGSTTGNAGATVAVEGAPNGTTDASGAFSVQVPFNGRSHPVHVFKARYTAAFDTVVVPEGAPCDHNYTLNLTCFGITGTVTLPGESDMSGVTLTAGGITATTIADGSYEFDSCLVNGDYTLTAHKTCWIDQSQPITLTGAGVVQNFTLVHSTLSIAGIISLEGMSDMSGTMVTVEGQTPVTTNATGQYSVDGLTCGQTYSVTVTHNNFATVTRSVVADGSPFSVTLSACNNAAAFRSSDSTEHVVLTWNLPSGTVDSFIIFRDGARLANVGGTLTTYTDGTVTFGRAYTYNIQAFYALCSSTMLSTPITVHVVPAVPTARILVLDFDNGLTNGPSGVSDTTVFWLRELAGAGTVQVTAENQNLGAYGQAWLNHFDLVFVITAQNGSRTEYFDTATASMLNAYITAPTKKMYWEGASAVTDLATYPAVYQNLLSHFGVTATHGSPSTTGNAQFVYGNFAWYQTHTRFGYAYHAAVDNDVDVLGLTGSGARAAWSLVGTDTTTLTRIVKTDNTAFSSIYSAGITSPLAPSHHNGRRMLDPYLCNWLGICTSVELENPNANVETPTLYQNEPNPFSNVTTIRFAVPSEGATRLDVYSVTGELLSTLVDKSLNAGSYSVDWNSGSLSSGVYLYRLSTPQGMATKAMTISK